MDDLSRTTTTSTTSSLTPVHPMELVVQSLLESPLELLSLNLNSLYESQAMLSTILKRLEEKLGVCLENIGVKTSEEASEGSSQTTLEEYAARVKAVRQAVERITAKLEAVEAKVGRIEENMG